jgi:formiminotetrahydrofolate cyclodeaminase
MNFEERPFAEFSRLLSSSDPTPGGGTASAAAGNLGAALISMVLDLTLSREKFKDVFSELKPIQAEARETAAELLRLMNDDARAFDRMVESRKLPKDTEEQKAARRDAMEKAARHAAEIPMQTARNSAALLSRIPLVAEKGNPNAASDAGVAALLLAAAAEGALLNVGINLSSIGDAAFVEAMERETAQLSGEVERLRAQVIAIVRRTFKK